MLGCKEATNDPKEKILKDVGKKTLADAMRARACVKTSGRFFEHLRIDMGNGRLALSTECTADTVNYHLQMEYFFQCT